MCSGVCVWAGCGYVLDRLPDAPGHRATGHASSCSNEPGRIACRFEFKAPIISSTFRQLEVRELEEFLTRGHNLFHYIYVFILNQI